MELTLKSGRKLGESDPSLTLLASRRASRIRDGLDVVLTKGRNCGDEEAPPGELAALRMSPPVADEARCRRSCGEERAIVPVPLLLPRLRCGGIRRGDASAGVFFFDVGAVAFMILG